jgi:uncharacterized protein (UPF0332 family)
MFDPREFLAIARQLLEVDEQTEGGYRTAISRAYYAAFWIAREKCVDSPGFERLYEERSHDKVWDYLVGDIGSSGESLGDIGQRLKRRHVRADYRNHEIGFGEATAAVKEAARLIADLENLM